MYCKISWYNKICNKNKTEPAKNALSVKRQRNPQEKKEGLLWERYIREL